MKHNETTEAPLCTTRQASRNSPRPGGGPSALSGRSASHNWILRSAGQHRPVAIDAARTQQPSPIHGQACDIRGLSLEAEKRLQEAATCAGAMNRATEQLLELVSRFRTGSNELEAVIDLANRWRDTLEARIQALADQGLVSMKKYLDGFAALLADAKGGQRLFLVHAPADTRLAPHRHLGSESILVLHDIAFGIDTRYQ